MKPSSRWFVLWLLLAAVVPATGATVQSYAWKVSNLIHPAKLATLRERGANPRIQKYVALLAEAKAAGLDPRNVAVQAVTAVGMKGEAAQLTVEAMVRNLTIAERLGCLDSNGLRDLRRGQAPTVQRGPYRGDELSVDHIIPRTVAPELDNVIANLELLPLRENKRKNSNITARQVDLARKFKRAGLLREKTFLIVLKNRR